jgi:hypothetical protein
MNVCSLPKKKKKKNPRRKNKTLIHIKRHIKTWKNGGNWWQKKKKQNFEEALHSCNALRIN